MTDWSKSVTRKLSHKEVPDGSVIAVLSDIHIPGHDERVMDLVVECCERVGATHLFINGDGADCGPASRHEEKKKRAVLDEGCLKESIAAGIKYWDWFRTRGNNCKWIFGNHERWVCRYIEGSPELKGSSPLGLMGLPELGWEVLPPLSCISLGNYTWEHGDGLFPSGNGGANPMARIKTLVPDRSTSIGHLHRMGAMFWTTPDADGIMRTRAARLNGHLSLPEYHEEYAGRYTNWQQSFELTWVFYVDGKPRFTTYQIEIHRDRFGRPFFHFGGHLYR